MRKEKHANTSMEAFSSPRNYLAITFCTILFSVSYLQYSKISAVQKYITNLLEYLHGHFLDSKGEKRKIIRT